jgi:hypothetical protein
MGDRANVVVETCGERVFLYTHWQGSSLPLTLQAALKRGQGRWDDPAYLARIIFCEMVAGQEKETTGFGISASICDNEWPLLIVNVDDQQVRLANARCVEVSKGNWEWKIDDPHASIHIGLFVDLDLEDEVSCWSLLEDECKAPS